MAPEASDGREMDEASPTWLLRQVPPSALRTDVAVQRIRSLLPKPRRSLRRQDNKGPRAGQARKRTAPQPDPRDRHAARAPLLRRAAYGASSALRRGTGDPGCALSPRRGWRCTGTSAATGCAAAAHLSGLGSAGEHRRRHCAQLARIARRRLEQIDLAAQRPSFGALLPRPLPRRGRAGLSGQVDEVVCAPQPRAVFEKVHQIFLPDTKDTALLQFPESPYRLEPLLGRPGAVVVRCNTFVEHSAANHGVRQVEIAQGRWLPRLLPTPKIRRNESTAGQNQTTEPCTLGVGHKKNGHYPMKARNRLGIVIP